LPSIPLLETLERTLGATRILGAPYKATRTPFRVEGGRVFFDRLRLESEQVAIDLGGWTSFEGPLDLRLAVRAPRPGMAIKGVPGSVLDALTDEEGWVSVPFDVKGTSEAPRVRPDVNALLRQARRAGSRTLIEKGAGVVKGLWRDRRLQRPPNN